MEFRSMQKLGISVSLLGFGCMRFPTRDGAIDEELSEKMLDLAYKSGVNYFDTAYPYHGGKSEPFVGRVLAKYDRDSYFLATKLPSWEVKSLEDAEHLFYDQLKRLGKDYVDFYLLHSLNKSYWDKMVELGVLEFCDKLKQEGKIRYFGFSFHDEYPIFEEIVTSRTWDFCQIQLNYMDTEEQAGMKGYHLAESLGIPVVIMEPVKGGSLAGLPDDIVGLFRESDSDASVASWAMRWVGSLPGVKAILSGMSTLEQVQDNLKTFRDFRPLSGEEQKMVLNVSEILKKRVNNGCTGCNYCMPCPKGVNIPHNFHVWNNYGVYGNVNSTRWQWNHDTGDAIKAKNCVSCGLCEKACPQKIEIRKDLGRLQKELDSL